jgi:hypothetical protein
MDDGDLFFTERNGEVWAVWLSGRPPVNLGSVADVRAAMAQFSVLAGANGVAASDSTSPQRAPEPPEPPPPKLRTASERVEQRHGITMMGRVFTTAGSREVTVLDLSERGCRFRDASGHLAEGARVSIKLGAVGPVEAMVMWSDGSFVGVRFANPLYPSVMQHIRETCAGRR